MKAVRYHGKETLRIEDIEKPVIGDDEALVGVHRSGICGSDLYIYSGAHPRAKAPLVPGHEISGEIVELPAGYAGVFAVGDRVTVNPLLSCGICRPCRTGHSHVCRKLGLIGIDADGGFAEFVKVGLSQLVKLPDGLSPESAALAEPLAVAVHAVRSSRFRTGDTVLVIGGGPIGLLTAYAAAAGGAGKIALVEPNEFRRSLCGSMGFRTFAGVDDEGIAAFLGEDGADIVFEAAGVPPAIEAAIRYCRILGQVVVVGVFKHPAPVDLQRINFAEIDLIGVRVYRDEDIRHAVEMLAKHPELEKTATHTFPFSRAQEAFDLVRNAGQNMKVLLAP